MHNESEKHYEYLLYAQELYIEQEYRKDGDVHRLILNQINFCFTKFQKSTCNPMNK
jgi:hypothetical protein